MNTGDSNYITPYVPHSFAGRNPEIPGLIIAVTYGGAARKALNDLAFLDGRSADRMAGDKRDPLNHHQAILSRHLAAESLDPSQLAAQLRDAGMDEKRAKALAAGGVLPIPEERTTLAAALHIPATVFQTTALKECEEVVVSHHPRGRPFPNSNQVSALLRPLARTCPS